MRPPCHKCEYDLSGLVGNTNRCPECGTPIGRPDRAHEDRLHLARSFRAAAPAAILLALATAAAAMRAGQFARALAVATVAAAVLWPFGQALILLRRGELDEPWPAFVAFGWFVNFLMLTVLGIAAVFVVMLSLMRW